MRDLIAELTDRKSKGMLGSDDRPCGAFEPLSCRDLAQAEEELGFGLTPLLRRLYVDVANGGFGPAYGLLGLHGGKTNEAGFDSVAQYKFLQRPHPDDKHWVWPNGLLPVGHVGCAMFLCVDCTNEKGPVILFEPNPHEHGTPWRDAFFPLAESTEEWLFAWLDGEDLLRKFMMGQDDMK
jgi:hypothetical protein